MPSGGKSEDGGGGGTSLHAEQHYEYHRPLVVGDVLHARGRKGETWEKQGRSGTLKFTELITEYLDAERRGRDHRPHGRGADGGTQVSISAASLKVGDSKEQLLVDDLTRTQIVMYAGASGDYNPLHSDEKFAREVAGYPGIFAHGMLTMGMTGRVVTDWFDVGRVTKYGVRFVRQVWPGATLTATAVVDAIREEDGAQFADVSITTVDAEGTTVLTGTATARLDP